jgi:O-antigen ligase
MLERSAGRVAEVLPAALALAPLAVLAGGDGGFDPEAWYPVALFLLAAAAVVAWVRSRPGSATFFPSGRLAAAALALLALFTLWSFASILWAASPATALEGANRALLLLLVYCLVASCSWRAATAAAAMGIYTFALAVVAIVTVTRLVTDADPAPLFIDGRLAEPTGYQNATAALFLGGLWPALALSSRAEVPWPVRGLLLASAGLFVQVAILAQSRGAALVLPIALVIFVALSPRSRLRAVGAGAIVGAGAVLCAPALLDVYETVRTGDDPDGAISSAARAMALCAVVTFALGCALSALDRRRLPSERLGLIAGRVAAGVLVLGVLVGAGAAATAIGDPKVWVDERWEDFKGGYDERFEQSRFSGDIGSNRYDFWRVGLSESFADAPLTGQGADNFAIDYLRERESAEEPRYPHSLPVRLLAGTGLIGAALFLGFLGLAFAAAVRGLRRTSGGLGAAIAAAAIASGSYWFLHSSGDWLLSFVAVSAPPLAWLAMAAGLPGAEPPTGAGPRSRGRSRWLALTGAGLLSVVLAAAVIAPWLAVRWTERGVAASGEEDPARAYDLLDAASGANPLSAEADVIAGSLAVRARDHRVAVERFERALEREPDNWYALLMLGAVEANGGSPGHAIELFERAREVNPSEPLVHAAIRRATADRAISTADIEAELLSRVCDRLGEAGSRACATDG